MRGLGVLILAAAGAGCCWACENREPLELQIRLETPLATGVSKKGAPFKAVAIAPLARCDEVLIPAGSVVSGHIRKASAIGLGLIHERASLELDFQSYELPDGRVYPFRGRIENIDNAREEVTPSGQIKGILAASGTHRFVRGIWYQPTSDLLPRSVAGLTGVAHQVWKGMALSPEAALGLFAVRLIAFRFPDPEIRLPEGTDFDLAVTSLPGEPPAFPSAPEPELAEPLADWISSQPFQVTKPDDSIAKDVVNVAFVGTREQLFQAFDAAGWDTSDRRRPGTIMRTYGAFESMAGYPTAPVSKLYYQDESPEVVFQKSFNSVSMRHHVRIWPAGSVDQQQVWLGAATHDVAVGLRGFSMTVTHKIDPNLDRERGKIATDLGFAGCAVPLGYARRPEAVRSPAEGNPVSTDGRIEVFQLQECDASNADPATLPDHSRRVTKLIRRTVLETRQHLLRENIYYYGFQAVKGLAERLHQDRTVGQARGLPSPQAVSN
jgi:LssY C-terminus